MNQNIPEGLRPGDLKNPWWICPECQCVPCAHDMHKIPLGTKDLFGYVTLGRKDW